MSIEKIKIVIKTAIPGKETFELKRDVLYIPDSQDKAVPSSEYPFITSTRIFNKTELQNYAYTYGYSKIVFYFFDKIMFERLFTQFTFVDNVDPIKDTMSEKDKKKRKQKIKENLITNIKIMLELLFPMTYPATLNISDSYTLYIRQNIDFDLNTAFSNITKNFFKKIMAVTQSVQTKNFSYIKVDGIVYTITKVIWLNDLLNHPVYRDFINEFIGFKQLASQQREALDGIITNKKNILFERLQKLDESSSSLNIYSKFISIFIKNFNESISSLQRQGKYDTSSLQRFINDLKNIILLLLNVLSLHYQYENNKILEIQKNMETNIKDASNPNKTLPDIVFYIENLPTIKNINQDEYLPNLSILVNDINELYKKTKENNAGSLTGISGAFTSRLNKILEEIKSINVNIVIKDKYLSDKTTINLSGEDPDVVDILTKKFPSYISFADKIKALIYPTTTTTNIELQERIDNYSNGKPMPEGEISFDDIMEAIKEQYILMTTTKPNKETQVNLLTNIKHQRLIQTELCALTDSNPEVPHYEIYIALNMIEGEMKSDNLDDIKCVYRSMFLGKELQSYFTKYNKYDVNQHLFLLSQKDINEEKITNTNNVSVTSDNNIVPKEGRLFERVQAGTRKKNAKRKLKTRKNKLY